MTREKLGIPAIATLCYVGVAAFTLLNGMPAIAAALHSTRHLSNAEIGWISADYLSGLALASAVCPWIMRTVGNHRLLQLSVLTVVAGLGLLALPLGIPVSYLGFGIVGIGTGASNALIYVLFGERDQERNFALYYASQWTSSLGLLYFLPQLITAAHLASAFLCLAGINLISLGILAAVPLQTAMSGIGSAGNGRVPVRPSLRWLSLSGIAAVFACQGAIWVFLEIAPVQRGLPVAQAQAAAILSPIFGLIGSLGVVFLGRRLGQKGPLIVAALLLVGSLLAMLSLHPRTYASGVYLFMLAFSAFSAYQFGMATEYDRSGFTAAWASTASYGGFAVGPAVAGVASMVFGPDAVILVGICTVAFALLTCAILLRHPKPLGEPASLLGVND